MSGSVFVVQEQPTGRWIASCCDVRCAHENVFGEGVHILAETDVKSRAEAAATRHRRYLRTIPTFAEKPRSDECGHCGQSAGAIAELQSLVAELERRLTERDGAP